MSLQTVRKLVLIGCITVSGSGCSYWLVNGPPSGHQGLDDFSCTESKAVPAIDLTLAAGWGAVAAVALTSDPNSGSESVGKAYGIGIGLTSLVVTGIAANKGFTRVSRCRAAKAELARRSQEAAEGARLMSRADSTGPPHMR